MLNKFYNHRIWTWEGWTIIKWPFGFFILWLVLTLIWNMETRADYDKELIESAKTRWSNTVGWFKDIDLRSIEIKSEKIKNVE